MTLERSYRWLLLAYPRWYRHERGLEMLTTMLDAAGPGQTRPTRHDVIDIVGGGIRRRFRLARSFGSMVACVLAAVAVACAAAAAAGLLLIGYLAPIPTETQAMAVALTATGINPNNVPGPVLRCDYFCPDGWETGGDQVASFDDQVDRNVGLKSGVELMPPGTAPLDDHVNVVLPIPGGDPSAVATNARARLTAQGWQVGPIEESFTYRSFWATDGDLALYLSATTDGGPQAHLIISRSFPTWGAVLIVAAFLGGLFGGWAAVGWVTRRIRRHHPAVRALVTIVGLPLLLVIAVAEAGTALAAVFAVSNSAHGLLSPAVVLSLIGEAPVVLPLTAAATIVMLALAAMPLRTLPNRDIPNAC